MLTAEQVARFREQGWLAPLRALDERDAAACRACLESYEAETGASACDTLHMKSHIYFDWLWRLLRAPPIREPLCDLLGEDLLVLASRFWIKEPDDGTFVTWHEDTAYFGLEPTEMVTLWLALSPATEKSGAMRFLPGSHLGPPPGHVETQDPKNLLSRGQRVPDVDDSGAIQTTLRPGEFSIHHGRLLHDSPPNRSADRRIGFGLMVIPTSVRSTTGRRSATLYSGSDRFDHWDHDPEPTCNRDPVIWHLMNQANRHYRTPRSAD